MPLVAVHRVLGIEKILVACIERLVGDRQQTWRFVEHVLAYIKNALKSPPGTPFTGLVDSHFATLLLISPYLTESARTVIKALTSLPSLGYLLIETSGLVPWDNTQADLLYRSFGRRCHDIKENTFKIGFIHENVMGCLASATRSMVESSGQGAILKNFLELMPREYYFGNFQTLGLPVPPPVDGYGTLLADVANSGYSYSGDVSMEQEDILGQPTSEMD